ncbi:MULTISPECIES: M20 aminoacylase family protein [Serratia]|uniref:M20 aminoacylase family protein n=1 Tax=Serratia TaxID=613 RepID=UPI0004165AA7|nr:MULTISPECIES: M20 aminoacylase family protein [Serratia]SAQ10425.1 peptidase subunit A [Klebsiella oxytoca]AVU37485.1 amidohydrolase [Serratia marcescens]AVU42571.1 amidohydrolase [Serratia marcescens]EGT0505972.1 amidohydrolase [Serratia marcescens]EHT9831018.1 amidohydrolase [Serratia marcescens]
MSFHTILPEVHELMPPMVALRQHLHAHPELSEEEFDTSRLVADKLRDWGYDVHHGLAGTGVVASLRKGQSQRIVGLRADMDALPIVETSGLPYASRHSGKMHACGHDGHTAMLLAAGQCLAQSIDFDGTVRLIFQPAEEGFLGAKRMVEDGLFQRFPCDAVFALHNWPGLPVGCFGFLPGAFMASADTVTIRINGRGGHGAMPHETADPVVAAASLVMALQTVVARNLPPLDTGVVGIGSIHGGSSSTVVPTCVELAITVRALKETTRHLLLQRIEALAHAQAAAFGTTAEVSVDANAYPVLYNHPEETDLARSVALSWLGEDGVLPDMQPMTCSEDFSFMLQACPGSYLIMGNGQGTEGGCPLHNPAYDFNDAALPYGASYWVRLVSTFLKPAG